MSHNGSVQAGGKGVGSGVLTFRRRALLPRASGWPVGAAGRVDVRHLLQAIVELGSFETEVFFATLRIEATNPATSAAAVGTGFLIQCPVPGFPGKSSLALVTCKHVLFGGDGEVTLTFHRKTASNPDVPHLGDIITFPKAIYTDAYVEHANPDLDIAAINATHFIKAESEIFIKNLHLPRLRPVQSLNLLPTNQVFFVGYPIGFYDRVHNLPILRSGHVASFPSVDFNGLPEFVIDAQVFPGSSGSPVFAEIDQKFELVGMIGRSVTRQAIIEEAPTANQEFVKDFIGLGIVYKTEAIMDVARLVALRMAERVEQGGAA